MSSRPPGPERARRWNFHKHLIASEGTLVGAWSSPIECDSPEITAALEAVLEAALGC